jgi:site-specific DNA-methyltransferase (adenine-specific)
MNALYYGDNLAVLRESIKDETVDLIYLDPPFNSSANYNVLFKAPSGEGSQAQIEAFEDTWHWNEHAELAFDEVMHSGNTEAANMLKAMRSFLGENDMMAYLAMMAVRLIELHRVLKQTGSIYLHCDPTASHYLKILLDSIFGPTQFRNEIIWQRTSSHNDPKRYGRIHDAILYYSRSDKPIWNQIFEKPDADFFDAHDFEIDDSGYKFRKRDLTAPYHGGPSGQYKWKDKLPPKGRMWSFTFDNMINLEKEGRIVYTKTGMPRLKILVEDLRGLPLQDVWSKPDLWLNAAAQERLGYPTQKPLALLERIISASSSEGDLILDPFCGCGTATHAAEKLKRQWIGIDITHLAIGLIERRLKDAFPGIKFEVHGTPKDFAGAENLALRDKYQFQWWAVTLINAVPYGGKKKGADGGIDGYYYCKPDGKKTEGGIVSVKGGDNLHVTMVRELHSVMESQKSPLGVLITLREPTGPMVKEAASAGFFQTAFGQFPRIQIATVEQLLEGKLPKLPPQEKGGGYKQAPQENPAQNKLL